MNSSNFKSALYTTGSYLCELAFKMVTVVTKSKTKEGDINMNEMLFYGGEDEEQSKQVGLNNLLCIYYVVLHACRTVDVCVPSLISETMTKCLISVKQRNEVKIRVTIHNGDFHHMQSFADNGIEVKLVNSAVALEHEFILIDASEDFEDAVAVIGSIDYETGRVNCNMDATVLTSDITVVKALIREFDRVWYSDENIAFGNENKDYKHLVEENN